MNKNVISNHNHYVKGKLEERRRIEYWVVVIILINDMVSPKGLLLV